ncbi:MAG: citryl-CoA lyase [Chloroflexota bacterium]
MSRERRPLRSDIAWSAPDRIVVRGYDLAGELLGRVNLGDMAFLGLMGRLPTPQESAVFNAMLVALVEHGLTPSALAARLTYLGAPEALQGAVAAGLLGLGNVFVGSLEGAARMLQEALEGIPTEADLRPIAARVVAGFAERKALIPGIGHPIHKPVDPRTPRLFAIAAEAEGRFGRSLPVNATGAVGALASELGIPWQVCRGLGVMARAVGLVGHILEEMRQPLAEEVWLRVDAEATAHLWDPAEQSDP